ncbi:hypothetical protein RchiOBHm_Chr7g0229871 [Rosa chinensis]|uniref:Uncharacterized protein n=1 Tax=Rosa chinensis TaxID=74649 RepID=A0A2P6PF87_ROSCH|nr:hypothetical protein RchiOBHm_Chr7g0229871 [Rosa chinensis]
MFTDNCVLVYDLLLSKLGVQLESAWLVVLGKMNTCDVLQKKRPGSCSSPHWCI